MFSNIYTHALVSLSINYYIHIYLIKIFYLITSSLQISIRYKFVILGFTLVILIEINLLIFLIIYHNALFLN